jgi:hypothetical protein
MKAIILILVTIIFTQACADYKTRDITDFSKEQVVILLDKVHPAGSIEFYVKGNIDGEIRVILRESYDAKLHFAPVILSGRIDTLLQDGDWYNDTIYMDIRPLGIAKGNLSVRYVIHGSII